MKHVASFVVAVLGVCALSSGQEKKMIQDYFNDTGKGVVFATDDWSVKSEDGRGWVSLKVKDAEFLHAEANFGGMVVQKGNQFFTNFPGHSNLSHDSQLGRLGQVVDGVNMIQISPDWQSPRFELYFGANEKESQKLIVWLGDDVSCVRIGGFENNRPFMTQVVDRKTKAPLSAQTAVVVHKSGYSLTVKAVSPGKDAKGADQPVPSFNVGMFKDPAGVERLAIVFDCKGFAANPFQVIVDPVARAENFAVFPTFRVISSDDPNAKGYVRGATNGVINPVYGPDTKLDFGVQFGWLGEKPFNGYVELDVIHSLGQQHYYERKDLKGEMPKDGQILVKFNPKFHIPGVSEVWARLVDDSGKLIWVDRYRMGYDLSHYKPALHVEPDFKAFWDKTLDDLHRVPLEPNTIRVEEFKDHPVLEVYEVSFNSYGGKRIYAMMFVPKDRKGPLPAFVTAHPGTTGYDLKKESSGLYGSKVREDLRFVTIVPLIRGYKPDEPNPFNAPWWGPLDSRDDYVARSWYCALVRAVDYLATRPDLVDMKRIVSSGGSQGGAFALVLAALDPRVTVCLADCPACCQPNEIMSNYGSFGPTKGQVPPGQTLADLEKMLSYYNPVNFCPYIKCPAYVGSNIGDLTVHSMGPLAAYHNLTGLKPEDKAFYPGYTHDHGSGEGLYVKSQEWLDKLGGPKKEVPADKK